MSGTCCYTVALLALVVCTAALIVPAPQHSPQQQQQQQQKQKHSSSDPQNMTYEVHYYDQILSHFHNTAFYRNTTFKQKYLINTDYFDPNFGNIFFYAGGESAIEGAWNHSSFIKEIAPQFRAMLIFIEHRFYGESLPNGNGSYVPPYTDLMTVEQALADYATVLESVLQARGVDYLPVMVFGGSYPGILAALMRIRYPQFVDGALAASAPLYTITSRLPDNLNNNTFFEVITSVADEGVPGCSDVIRRNYAEIDELYKANDFKILSDRFGLCTPIANAKDYKQFLGWIQIAWASMAMGNYPFPADFTGHLPAWPINVTCQNAIQMSSSMAGLAFSTQLFYNSTGSKQCFDTYADYYYCSDPTGCGLGNDARSWDLQVCSELGLGSGPTGVTDMFAPQPWTVDDRTAYCTPTWGTEFATERLAYQFEMDDLTKTSNIIFSNGLLDPWWTGGIRRNISDSLIAILIPEAAHHLDLWGSNPADPQSVKDARNTEIHYINIWMNEVGLREAKRERSEARRKQKQQMIATATRQTTKI